MITKFVEMDAIASKNHYQTFDLSIEILQKGGSKCLDDDGRPKRTGTVWTASAHIITAVIGSGVLSLAWAIAQLGWIAGPSIMLLFSFITYYTSVLLSDCYRSGDPVTGKRNHTYMDAIHSYFGDSGFKVRMCALVQYANLFGGAIGYTIAASTSMMSIEKANCLRKSGGKSQCHMNSNTYMISFGIVEIIFSQIPGFHQLWWLSIVAAIMSFAYSTVGLGLSIAKCIENGRVGGSLVGISIDTETETDKVWRIMQALGDIAFAYSYSFILIEIQDTVKSPPSESKTMKRATFMSVVVTTVFYMLCGCFGYAAFGDSSPGNLLTGFGFSNTYWLLDIANAALVIHLIGAYQVYCQPLFAFIEKNVAKRFPNSELVIKDIEIPLPGFHPCKLNFFRLVWRTIFVIVSTVLSMLFPFFNDMGGLIGAIAFWPLTVYFPVEMFIIVKRIPKWSTKWMCLQMLSIACLLLSIGGAAGSIAGIVIDLKTYKPFKTNY